MEFSADLADKVKPMLKRVKEMVRERVKVEGVSAKEALDRIRAMNEDERRRLITQTGEDEFVSRIEDLMERVERGK